MKRYFALLVLSAALVAIPGGTASAHGVVDQQFEGGGQIRGTHSLLPGDWGQSFVPMADTLNSVDLRLSEDEPDSTAQITIHEDTPDGNRIAGPVTTEITNGVWTHIDFPAIAVNPGQTYVIRAHAVSGNPFIALNQVNFGGPDYPDGEAWICDPDCEPVEVSDVLFRTYREERPTCGGVEATILGTAGDDTILGGSGADVIVALAGDDIVRGNGGDDVICGGLGRDVLIGGDGADTIFGQRGSDVITGGNGKDRLLGGPGADTILGNGGHDVLFGQGGNDDLLGGFGNDDLRGGLDDDTANGGTGTNSCVAETMIRC